MKLIFPLVAGLLLVAACTKKSPDAPTPSNPTPIPTPTPTPSNPPPVDKSLSAKVAGDYRTKSFYIKSSTNGSVTSSETIQLPDGQLTVKKIGHDSVQIGGLTWVCQATDTKGAQFYVEQHRDIGYTFYNTGDSLLYYQYSYANRADSRVYYTRGYRIP